MKFADFVSTDAIKSHLKKLNKRVQRRRHDFISAGGGTSIPEKTGTRIFSTADRKVLKLPSLRNLLTFFSVDFKKRRQ